MLRPRCKGTYAEQRTLSPACLFRALDRALGVARPFPHAWGPLSAGRSVRTPARLVRCAAEQPPVSSNGASRRRGTREARPQGGGGTDALAAARQDLEQEARHWAFLNSVGLQPETVHSLLQRAPPDGTGARGGEDDAFAGAQPATLAELVDVVEYLMQSGYGRNKAIITGLRTFFTRNDTARFLAALGVRDVGRTLVRFPQLLRYDVDAVLQPRADFLRRELGITDVGLAVSRHPMLLIYRYARRSPFQLDGVVKIWR